MTQLVVCLVLFLTVFVGKGIFPRQMTGVRDQILSVISQDTDFQAAFSALGQAVSQGEPVTDALGTLWENVLGTGGVTAAASTTDLYQQQLAVLCGQAQALEVEDGLWTPVLEMLVGEPQKLEPTEETSAGAEQETADAESLVEHVDYDGPELPDNATMDKYDLTALGIGETVTPALGWVSSSFGWREHPVDGEERFHNGIDLAVNTGTDVLAFADGTVDYIGDSPVYGLYLQISHAGGVQTFYCHCSQLCVQQGQTVTAGEKVAESGETGNATGPHLHFEIKLNGVLLNPIYYIETQ